MITDHPDLSKISQVTNNIYLSGIFPMEENYQIIKQLGIKYILCCVDKKFVSDTHKRVSADNPDITILYLPYNDDHQQNLWAKNVNQINMTKYASSVSEFDKLLQQVKLYNNKSMIEIGYHFINHAVSNNDIVLVHCMAGISRSVSLVSYYLMKKNGIPFSLSISTIKSKRPVANPNTSFKSQLQMYGIKKDAFSTTDADNIIAQLKYRSKYKNRCGIPMSTNKNIFL